MTSYTIQALFFSTSFFFLLCLMAWVSDRIENRGTRKTLRGIKRRHG